MTTAVPFILASASPRRRVLLERLGVPFDVLVSEAEEVAPDSDPASIVRALAALKASDVAGKHPDALVLGADTIVYHENTVLGKPADPEEARTMLRRLSAAVHIVYTGIALQHQASGRSVTAAEATRVTFAPLSSEEIDRYVASGSPLDKAGAYGIQDDHGALFVSKIEGDYYTVVGLPLHRLYETLKQHFADLITW